MDQERLVGQLRPRLLPGDTTHDKVVDLGITPDVRATIQCNRLKDAGPGHENTHLTIRPRGKPVLRVQMCFKNHARHRFGGFIVRDDGLQEVDRLIRRVVV